MLSLIKSELSYLKLLFIVLISLIPLLVFLQTAFEDMGNFGLIAILFLMLQNWNSFHNKERHEYRNFLLPLSVQQLAAGRLLMVLISSIFAVTLYFFIQSLFPSGKFSYNVNPAVIIGLIVLLFSLYFILRDLLLVFFRRIGLTASKMIMILAFIGISFNILGVYALIQTKSTGKPPAFLPWIIEGIKTHNPFMGEVGQILFLIFALVFGLLSLISYTKRKMYLE